jgi:hypothetical protein
MLSRRSFFQAGLGTAAASCALPGVGWAFAPPKPTITSMKVLRLRFPGKTARKRNSIIESGGGRPGMTYLE